MTVACRVLLPLLLLLSAVPPASAGIVVAGRWEILDIVDDEMGKVWPGRGLRIELRPDSSVEDARFPDGGPAVPTVWSCDGSVLEIRYDGRESEVHAGEVGFDEEGNLTWNYRVKRYRDGRYVDDGQPLTMRLRPLGAAGGKAPGRANPATGRDPGTASGGGGARKSGGLAWAAAESGDDPDGSEADEADESEEICSGNDGEPGPVSPTPAPAPAPSRRTGSAVDVRALFPHGAFIDGNGVRLRDAGSTSAREIATLRQGDSLEVLGAGTRERVGKRGTHPWYRVRVERTGKIGWVFGAFVMPVEICSN